MSPQTDGTFYAPILKADADAGFVLAPVLVPDEPDWQGDVISAEEIEKAAHAYMEASQRGGYMHRQVLGDADVLLVESSILRTDTCINGVALKAGTWLCGWKIFNAELREMIRTEKINGLSIGAGLWREPISDVTKYSEDQPRVPAGQPGGGQFGSSSSGGSGAESSSSTGDGTGPVVSRITSNGKQVEMGVVRSEGGPPHFYAKVDGKTIAQPYGLQPLSSPVVRDGVTYTHAIGNVGISATEATQLNASLAVAKQSYANSPEGLRGQRQTLVDSVRAERDAEASQRARLWERGDERGGVSHTNPHIAQAEQALRAFDAAHPEVKAVITREKQDAAARFARTD